jgi:hypothetical protein
VTMQRSGVGWRVIACDQARGRWRRVCGARWRSVEFRVASEMCTTRSQEAPVIRE